MGDFFATYIVLATWFAVFDCIAAIVGGIRVRPFACAATGMLWPLTMPFMMVAAAIVIRRLRSGSGSAGE